MNQSIKRIAVTGGVNVGTISHVGHGKKALSSAIASVLNHKEKMKVGINPALKIGKAEIIESDISKTLGQYEEQARLILLSWNIAKAEEVNEAAAIRKTARKLRDRTAIPQMLNLCRNLLKCKDDSRVVNAIASMQKSLDENGVIFTGKS